MERPRSRNPSFLIFLPLDSTFPSWPPMRTRLMVDLRPCRGGQVHPMLDDVFPMGEAPQAIRKVVAEHARGKTALVADFSPTHN